MFKLDSKRKGWEGNRVLTDVAGASLPAGQDEKGPAIDMIELVM